MKKADKVWWSILAAIAFPFVGVLILVAVYLIMKIGHSFVFLYFMGDIVRFVIPCSVLGWLIFMGVFWGREEKE